MISSLRSRFSRTPRRCFYLSGSRLTAYHARRGTLTDAFLFQRSDEGLADFAQYLEETRDIPSYLLADLVEEEYRRDTIPHVLGGDRRNVIRYRVERAFRDTPYWHGALQGREPEGRRDDRLLLCAITNPALVRPWVERIQEHKVPLAGIYSLPLVSQSLLPVLGAAKGEVLLISLQSTGNLRQSFFIDRQLKLSRLAHMPLLAPEGVAETAIDEVEKLRRYLNSLRLLPRTGSLHVHILAHGPVMEELVRQCASGPTTTFHLLDIADVAPRIGLTPDFVTPYADSLFVQQLLAERPANQYAQPAETRYYTHYRVRNFLRGSSVLLLVAGFLGGGFGVTEGLVLDQRARAAAQQADYYRVRYEEARGGLPPAPVEAADLKAAVETAERLARSRRTPLAVLAAVSQALDVSPALTVEQIEWRAAAAPEPNQATPRMAGRGTPRGATPPTQTPVPSEIALINGRVNLPEGSYRETLAAVRGLADALGAVPGVREVKILSQPIDVSPGESLRGDLQSRSATARSDFSIQVLYRSDDAPA